MSSGKTKKSISSKASYKRKESRHDKWYKLAKEQGYRSRAAFKLIQINKKYNILSSSKAVIDLCACPGGWLQVCSKYMPVSSLIIGVDIKPMKPIRGVRTLMADITTQKCRSMVKKETLGWQVDGVLHDGSPNVGGATWAADAYQQIELVLHSLKLASEFLRKGGWFVSKLFRSQDYNSILWVLNQFFKKVEVFKPQASRQQSAEIFVVCLDYQAPKKIDPKMFDPAHVFKSVEAPKKVADVMHASKNAKRNRSGYEDDAKQVLHKTASVREFIEGPNPVQLLGTVNEFRFDKESEFYAQHPKTTDEIRTLITDLRVLGKSDFNAILKWRKKLREAHAELMKEQQPKVDKPAKPELSAEEKADLEEKKITTQLEELKDKLEHNKKKAAQKKHEEKMKAKKRMLLNKNSSTEGEQAEDGVFKLSLIKDSETLERLTGDAANDETTTLDLDELLSRERSDSDFSDNEGQDAPEEEQGPRKRGPKILSLEASVAPREAEDDDEYEMSRDAELESGYAEFKKRRQIIDHKKEKLGLEGEDGDTDTKLPDEAEEEAMPVDLGDEDEDADSEEESKSRNPLEVEYDDYDAKLPSGNDTAGRWFGRDLFADIGGGDLSARAKKGKGLAPLSDSSDSDSEDNLATQKRGKANKSRVPSSSSSSSSSSSAAYDADDVLTPPAGKKLKSNQGAAVATDKQKQPKEKKEKKTVSASASEAADSDSDADDPLLAKRKARKQQLKAKKEEQTFEEVPVEEDYTSDSDARAEMVAIGTAMLRKKRRREIEDAAYNRYAFHDDNVPSWFRDDELMHNTAQLPVTKAEVDEQKGKLKGIDARPMKKIAEAMGRKKLRALRRWEKARAAADAVTKSGESSGEKMRSLEKILSKATKKQKVERVYLVSKKSGTQYIKGKKGQQVVRVDSRMKKDKRAVKRNEAKKKKQKTVKNKKRANSKKA